MRGKDPEDIDEDVYPGITPAYAGKSPRNAWYNINRGDHPRLCGEKPFRCTVHVPYYGSPPPMRGKD